MTSPPRVSVVIPARNRESLIGACLASIAAQTCPPFEVIVVDDGSTDGTASIVEGFNLPGLRCVRLARSCGAQAARNEGIRQASGDWIAFQDSDDTWAPHKLARQLEELAKSTDADRTLVHCDGQRLILADGAAERIELGAFSGKCHARLLLEPGPMFQGMLVHRSRLLEIGLLDEACPAYQEWDTAIRLSTVCTFSHVPEPLFDWRWHSQGTMSKQLDLDAMGYHYVVAKHRRDIEAVHGKAGWRRASGRSLSRGLTMRAYHVVASQVRMEPPFAANLLSWLAARSRVCPPGTSTLVRAAARLLP